MRRRVASGLAGASGRLRAFAPSLASALILAAPAMAAVSGYWQSSGEIHAILGEEAVADGLRQQPVEAIGRIAPDGYEIRSRDCAIRVTVVPKPAAMLGRQRFDLRIGRAACR